MQDVDYAASRRRHLLRKNQEPETDFVAELCQGRMAMRSRRQRAWNQDDTVEMSASEDMRDDERNAQEAARQIVNDGRAMADIRRAVEDRGLDPIWVQLILEFGTMMYLEGWRSHWPPSSNVGDRRPR